MSFLEFVEIKFEAKIWLIEQNIKALVCHQIVRSKIHGIETTGINLIVLGLGLLLVTLSDIMITLLLIKHLLSWILTKKTLDIENFTSLPESGSSDEC